MTDLPDPPSMVIDYHETIPTHPGVSLIRLPRCAKCYDETHDYSFGKAFCIPSELSSVSHPMQYERMTDKQLDAWSRAERDDQHQQESEAP